MRVCMIAYSFYETDSRIIQYARSLTRRGDSVDVIALARAGMPRFELIDGVNVYRVQGRQINERGASSYLFRILRFLLVAMVVLTWKHLHKRYQLVHVHSVPDFLVISALPLRLMGVPVILDIHDILPEFYASKFTAGQGSFVYRALLIIEKWSARMASHVIIANHLWYDRLIGRSVPGKKCSVICNYPNPELFFVRPKHECNGRFLLMYPGSLNLHQGLDIAIRAFAEVSSTLKSAEFHIYGEGPERPSLERLIEKLGLQQKIRVQNYQPTVEIARLMGEADLAIVPKRASSTFGNEAASTKVQEFMAVGVPVIVSRTRIDSFYFDESMVKFFESENVSALANAIIELYAHPEQRRKLVEGANRHIQKNNWDVKQYEYLSVVDSLMGKQAHASIRSNVVKTGAIPRNMPLSAGSAAQGFRREVVHAGRLGLKTTLSQSIGSLLSNFYRCPQLDANFTLAGNLQPVAGYFRIKEGPICYGRLSETQPAATADCTLPEVCSQVSEEGKAVSLPFDPAEVVANLRLERYKAGDEISGNDGVSLVRRLYYLLRPIMPVDVRKYLQRLYFRGWDRIQFPHWPVDRSADRLHEWLLTSAMKAEGTTDVPFVWFWPDGYSSCASVTHDVETIAGRDFCTQLMDLNDSYGIKTSFQVIPEERYEVPPAFLDSIRERGFEVNIHDLNHDGELFSTPEHFTERVGKINRYGDEFKARGFRSAVLYRRLESLNELDFAYDMSVPNVAHLDPQRGGCCTVMPYFIGDLVEIPVTTTQDYSLFHILSDYSTRLWEEQVTTITQAHGMASFIIHPDYVIEARARQTYRQLLKYLADLRTNHKLWIALPGEINDWWRARAQMQLVQDGDTWRVEGKGSERARVAYARADGNGIVYRIEEGANCNALLGAR
jgi:glycosyltransferase involved in cell wall biosynthesis